MLDRLDEIIELTDPPIADATPALAEELLGIGEQAMEAWLTAHDQVPTGESVEGFRLLAMHRQGARGDPSFNACRESCRELVYLRNRALAEPDPAAAARQISLGAMVARHLVLFVDGKLENSGLGEFCCSSRPLRQRDAGLAASGNP
jgi:hypothetical protein